MSTSLPSSPKRPAAPRGELRPVSGFVLPALMLAMLIRLLFGLIGRTAAADAEPAAPDMALIRDAARAVAVPAWASQTPRDMFHGTFGTRFVWVAIRVVGVDAATSQASRAARGTARPATGCGLAGKRRHPGKPRPGVGSGAERRRAVRARRGGPPARASPARQARRRSASRRSTGRPGRDVAFREALA